MSGSVAKVDSKIAKIQNLYLLGFSATFLGIYLLQKLETKRFLSCNFLGLIVFFVIVMLLKLPHEHDNQYKISVFYAKLSLLRR